MPNGDAGPLDLFLGKAGGNADLQGWLDLRLLAFATGRARHVSSPRDQDTVGKGLVRRVSKCVCG